MLSVAAGGGGMGEAGELQQSSLAVGGQEQASKSSFGADSGLLAPVELLGLFFSISQEIMASGARFETPKPQGKPSAQ